jgi:hypothetical protein
MALLCLWLLAVPLYTVYRVTSLASGPKAQVPPKVHAGDDGDATRLHSSSSNITSSASTAAGTCADATAAQCKAPDDHSTSEPGAEPAAGGPEPEPAPVLGPAIAAEQQDNLDQDKALEQDDLDKDKASQQPRSRQATAGKKKKTKKRAANASATSGAGQQAGSTQDGQQGMSPEEQAVQAMLEAMVEEDLLQEKEREAQEWVLDRIVERDLWQQWLEGVVERELRQQQGSRRQGSRLGRLWKKIMGSSKTKRKGRGCC